MMVFQYPIGRAKKEPRRPSIPQQEKPTEDAIGLVQGKQPQSKNEWFFALAMDSFRIEYIFQYPIYGGRTVRGGFVVDFVLLYPFPRPVELFDQYYHGAQMTDNDRLRVIIEERYFGQPVEIVWENETESLDKAKATVRRRFL